MLSFHFSDTAAATIYHIRQHTVNSGAFSSR